MAYRSKNYFSDFANSIKTEIRKFFPKQTIDLYKILTLNKRHGSFRNLNAGTSCLKN